MPAQEVADLNVTNVADGDIVGEQLADGWQDLHFEAGRPGDLSQLADQLGARAGDGDEQCLGAVPFGGVGDARSGADHGNAHDPELALVDVVVEQGNREVRTVGVAEHRLNDLHPAIASSEHERSGTRLSVRAAGEIKMKSPSVTHGRRQDDGEQTSDEGNALRRRPPGWSPDVCEEKQNRRHGDGLCEGSDLIEAAENPTPHVETHRDARQRLEDAGQADQCRDSPGVDPPEREFVPNEHGRSQSHRPCRPVKKCLCEWATARQELLHRRIDVTCCCPRHPQSHLYPLRSARTRHTFYHEAWAVVARYARFHRPDGSGTQRWVPGLSTPPISARNEAQFGLTEAASDRWQSV